MVTAARYKRVVIIEVLAEFEESEWRVSLCRANYRPGRCYVQIEKRIVEEAEDERGAWIVGFADDRSEAERLFDSTVRTVCLLATGRTEDADLGPGPRAIDLM